jgi:hypothetical protein
VTDSTWSNTLSRRAAARRDADQRADRAGQDHQGQRVQDAPADERADRLPVGERFTEVAMQDAGEPGPVLVDGGSGQAQLHLQCVQALGSRGVQEHRARGVARQDLGGGEHQDRHQHEREYPDQAPLDQQVPDGMRPGGLGRGTGAFGCLSRGGHDSHTFLKS